MQVPSLLLGIFDSGVGGFSVYKKIRPVTQADTIYYGDCLRAPYGNREDEEIKQFIIDDIRFLQDEGVTHFVNACNSMSVVTTELLLRECNVQEEHYTDMIRAFTLYAPSFIDATVLVIATNATIRSGAYQEVLKLKGAAVATYVFEDLALMIENTTSEAVILSTLEKCMVYAQESNATHMLFGCTHYPLVERLFLQAQENIGWRGVFIDPAVYVAEVVKSWNLEGERKFLPYSSKDTPAFIKYSMRCL